MAKDDDKWRKQTGGGRNTCSGCGGRGEVKRESKRVVKEDGKERTVTDVSWVNCGKCGGSGSG